MSMLARLNEQAQGFQNFQSEVESRINNFDLEHQMYSGAEAAYRLGHENMSIALGAETMRALHSGLPTVYKIGKAVGQRALGDQVRSPLSRPPPNSGGRATGPTPENPAGAGASDAERVATLPGGQPIDAATRFSGSVENFTQGPARNFTTNAIPESLFSDDAQKALSIARNTNTTGTQFFKRADGQIIAENPNLPRPRADLPEPTNTGRAPIQAVQSDIIPGDLQYPKAPALKGNLPIPRGPSGPKAAAAEPKIPYTPLAQTETPERQAVGRTLQAENNKPSLVYKFSKENRGRPPTEQAPPTGTPPAIPETPAKLPTPAIPVDAEGNELPTPAVSPPTTQAGQAGYGDIPYEALPPGQEQGEGPAIRPAQPELPTPAIPVDADGNELQPAARSAINLDTGNEAEDAANQRFGDAISRLQSTEVQGNLSRPMGATASDQQFGDAVARLNSQEVQANLAKGAAGGAGPAPDIAARAGGPAASTPEDLAARLAANEAKVAPEDAVEAAFPGIGEIIGGIIDAAVAVGTIAESATRAKDPAPKQPVGQPALATAFDSSPVINSADYHNL